MNLECQIELEFPDLAIIYFKVIDKHLLGDHFIAQYALPANCFREGMK
jgi:hypothetical protein